MRLGFEMYYQPIELHLHARGSVLNLMILIMHIKVVTYVLHFVHLQSMVELCMHGWGIHSPLGNHVWDLALSMFFFFFS